MDTLQARRFELDSDASHKFWEVWVEGSTLTVRFGRIGTKGQTKAKDHGTPDAAAKDRERLVRAKTRKGYVEVGGEAQVPATVVAALEALDDLKAWLDEQGAREVIAALRPPASADTLDQAEDHLGHPLPLELRAVYQRCDGQTILDCYLDTFFPYGTGNFLPIDDAVFGFHHQPWQLPFVAGPAGAVTSAPPERPVERDWIQRSTVGDQGWALRDEELNTAWLTFAWDETFHTLLHLRSGRVFRWTHGEGLSLLAESFPSFLVGLVDDVRKGRHVVQRDPYCDDEPLEERPWVWTTRS